MDASIQTSLARADMAVRLQLLGPPTVECKGTSSALPFERRSQVLAYLALKGSWVGRGELAAMLWPEQENRLAFTNLRKTLFRIQSLPWAPQLEVQGGALRLEAQTDVAAFEAALREGRMADAARLHRGDFLAGFDDDSSETWSSWLEFERSRLRAGWRGAVLAHVAGDIDPSDGIELSARLLELDPLDESALQAHMSWLARHGQGAQARQAYRDFVVRLRDDLGLSPGANLQALHESLGSPPASVVPATHAAQEDGFVGRSVELRQLATLLAQPECRLVTLIGPGGVGKTRLVRRALSELEAGFGHGVAFVPLEDATTPDEAAGHIARELEVPLAGRRDPFEQVVDFLRTRQLLLALDNFEQLAGHAAMLERLLRECAGVKIVATSRVRLGLSVEQLLPLEGLPCPDVEDHDRFEAFDAVRLFLKAARRVEPALVPEIEAAAIVDICRQVEGLPLALELAAAWTRVLSCEAIAAQLREGAQLLHAVDGSKPARHASMEVVFDQSWRLLTPAERDAVARLSVFHGGFSADAAKAVACVSLPVLGALVDKSLLRKEGARLHIHPLLHSLAASRLEAGTRHSEAVRAHALYFHRMMAQLRRGVEHGDREALQQIDLECPNCRAAWQWAFVHEMRELVARSMPTLLHFSDHRFRVAEGLALLREATESQAVRSDPRLEALLLASAAHLEYRLDLYAEAEARATRALAAAGDDDGATRLQCLKVLGGCCLRLGRLDEARQHFRQALRLSPANIDPHNAAAMLDNLALVEKSLGHYAESLRLSQSSLVQYRRLNDTAGEALCLNNLGDLHLIMGDLESAGARLREGLVLCERHGLVNTQALILVNLAEHSMKAGDAQAAETLSRAALEIAERTGQRVIAAWLKLQAAELAVGRKELARARADLAACLELAIAIGRPSLQFAGLLCFAEVLLVQGEEECARKLLAFSAGHASIGAPERDKARARLAKLAAQPADTPGWPGLELDEVLQRVVIEHDVAHAPLVTLLRGPHRA